MLPAARPAPGLAPTRDPFDILPRILEIIQGQELRIGDRLPPIRDLAATLGIKPTMVRDALLCAQTMGLVRIIPRSGAFLQSLSAHAQPETPANNLAAPLPRQDHNLFHLLDARRLLDIEMAGRAAERRRLEDLLPVRQALEAMSRSTPALNREEYVEQDVRFHVEIGRLAGNTVLAALQVALLEQLRSHLIWMPWTEERRRATDRSHAAIYAALIAGDSLRARAAMQGHLSLAYDALLLDLQQPPAHGPEGAPGGERADPLSSAMTAVPGWTT